MTAATYESTEAFEEAQEAKQRPAVTVGQVVEAGCTWQGGGNPVSRTTLKRAVMAGQVPGAWKDTKNRDAWMLPIQGLIAAGVNVDRLRRSPTRAEEEAAESQMTVRGVDLAAAAAPALEAAFREQDDTVRRYLGARGDQIAAQFDPADARMAVALSEEMQRQAETETINRLRDEVEALSDALSSETKRREDAERRAAVAEALAEERENRVADLHRAYGVREIGPGEVRTNGGRPTYVVRVFRALAGR